MFKKETLKETFSSLSIRNYRLYQIGQTISNTGTWIQTIGQSWLVLELTNSGTALGITIALQFLPLLVIGPWGGTIADRFPKRKLLYITQTTSGFLALILGLLVVSHTAELWMVYVLALLLGLVSAVDNPARNTFIPEMVGKS
ncbi:MAG: MFS transporter, partial [Candidatus Pacebacteria bacterium]|nr:MFS transporter [Candidatus Paceibacterota bacterium]